LFDLDPADLALFEDPSLDTNTEILHMKASFSQIPERPIDTCETGTVSQLFSSRPFTFPKILVYNTPKINQPERLIVQKPAAKFQPKRKPAYAKPSRSRGYARRSHEEKTLALLSRTLNELFS
jgi:hypothetical protein